MTDKKKYIKPITESFPMILEDIITKSPDAEEIKQVIDDDNDDWGDNVPPDDEFIW